MTIVHQSSPLAHCLCPFALLCRLKEGGDVLLFAKTLCTHKRASVFREGGRFEAIWRHLCVCVCQTNLPNAP